MRETDRAWIGISRENLLHNTEKLQRLSGAGCALMPAVKANAYGHGDILVSRILQDEGIRDYCVASADEGIRLRQAGISGQILILGYTHPDGFAELMHYSLTQTAVDLDYAGRLSAYAGKINCGRNAGSCDTIAVHIGVDTGMHRLGIPYDRPDLIEKVWALPGLRVTGMFSHLCVSDGRTDAAEKYTREQIQRFGVVRDYLHKNGIRGFRCHIQGSYGLLNYPEYSYDLSRPGIALYGCLSSADDRVRAAVSLKPVLSLKARGGRICRVRAYLHCRQYAADRYRLGRVCGRDSPQSVELRGGPCKRTESSDHRADLYGPAYSGCDRCAGNLTGR